MNFDHPQFNSIKIYLCPMIMAVLYRFAETESKIIAEPCSICIECSPSPTITNEALICYVAIYGILPKQSLNITKQNLYIKYLL